MSGSLFLPGSKAKRTLIVKIKAGMRPLLEIGEEVVDSLSQFHVVSRVIRMNVMVIEGEAGTAVPCLPQLLWQSNEFDEEFDSSMDFGVEARQCGRAPVSMAMVSRSI